MKRKLIYHNWRTMSYQWYKYDRTRELIWIYIWEDNTHWLIQSLDWIGWTRNNICSNWNNGRRDNEYPRPPLKYKVKYIWICKEDFPKLNFIGETRG